MKDLTVRLILFIMILTAIILGGIIITISGVYIFKREAEVKKIK